jgi:acyl carrier protein
MPIIEQISEVFARELGVTADEFDIDLRYGDLPEWDSMTHMNIVVALEVRFAITFNSEEIPGLSSIRAIESALRRKGVVDE